MHTARFKEELKEEKTRLEERLKSVGERNAGVPDDWVAVPTERGAEPDQADQADVIISHEGNAAILDELEARYDTVLAALTRLDNGTYGVCDVCGKKIEEARLEADPAATTCKEHKSIVR